MSKLNKKEILILKDTIALRKVSLWKNGDDTTELDLLNEKLDFIYTELLLDEINKK